MEQKKQPRKKSKHILSIILKKGVINTSAIIKLPQKYGGNVLRTMFNMTFKSNKQ